MDSDLTPNPPAKTDESFPDDELLIVELDNRLELGLALVGGDLEDDANVSTCNNTSTCTATNAASCTNGSRCS